MKNVIKKIKVLIVTAFVILSFDTFGFLIYNNEIQCFKSGVITNKFFSVNSNSNDDTYVKRKTTNTTTFTFEIQDSETGIKKYVHVSSKDYCTYNVGDNYTCKD